MALSIRHIYKTFEALTALADVTFDVPRGEIVAVLGPSGCGKSTLLGVISGLVTPDSGTIFGNDKALADVPVHQRGFGLMFQDYALFPHMNVFENIAFGLKMSRLPEQKLRVRVTEMLELVNLAGYEKRDVNTLSGGEQQRVALARALAPSPTLLMLDEPLGALDRTLREHLLVELKEILQRVGQTALYITHDQEEAFALADRVVLLNRGVVEQIGTPAALYAQPASPFAAAFLGMTNLLEGVVTRRGASEEPGWEVKTGLGVIPLQIPNSQEPNLSKEPAIVPVGAKNLSPPPGFLGEGNQVLVLLRPDAAAFEDYEGAFALDVQIKSHSFRGKMSFVQVLAGGVTLTFEFSAIQKLPEIGAQARLFIDGINGVQLFQRERGLRKDPGSKIQ